MALTLTEKVEAFVDQLESRLSEVHPALLLNCSTSNQCVIRVREYDDSQAAILTLNFRETRITAYGGPEGTAYPETVNEVLLLVQGALDDLYVDKEVLWQPHS